MTVRARYVVAALLASTCALVGLDYASITYASDRIEDLDAACPGGIVVATGGGHDRIELGTDADHDFVYSDTRQIGITAGRQHALISASVRDAPGKPLPPLLHVGDTQVESGVGTFTFLAAHPSGYVTGPRESWAQFCFEPDPTFELAPLRYPTSDPRHDPVCGYSWVTAPECLSIRPTPTPFDTEQS